MKKTFTLLCLTEKEHDLLLSAVGYCILSSNIMEFFSNERNYGLMRKNLFRIKNKIKKYKKKNS